MEVLVVLDVPPQVPLYVSGSPEIMVILPGLAQMLLTVATA